MKQLVQTQNAADFCRQHQGEPGTGLLNPAYWVGVRRIVEVGEEQITVRDGGGVDRVCVVVSSTAKVVKP
jgi:hypothetical protein